MNLQELVERQISMKELSALFEDGKPHHVFFLNAVFVDGEAIQSPYCPVLFAELKASSYEEFSDSMDNFTDAMLATSKGIVYDNLLVTRAAAQAGITFMRELAKLPNQPSLAMKNASTVLGMAMAAQDAGELELALCLSSELRDEFESYLSNPESWVPFEQKEQR